MEGNKSNSIKKDVIISEHKLRKTQNNPSSNLNNDMKNSYHHPQCEIQSDTSFWWRRHLQTTCSIVEYPLGMDFPS